MDNIQKQKIVYNYKTTLNDSIDADLEAEGGSGAVQLRSINRIKPNEKIEVGPNVIPDKNVEGKKLLSKRKKRSFKKQLSRVEAPEDEPDDSADDNNEAINQEKIIPHPID